MLDGRGASFACSLAESQEISIENSQNWQWSADLAHHVLITPTEVQVRSGRSTVTRKFQRGSVEDRLEEFLTFLDNSRANALPDVVSFLVQEFQNTWAANQYSAGSEALADFLLAFHAAGQSDPTILLDSTWRHQTADQIGMDPGRFEADFDAQSLVHRAKTIQERAPLRLRLVPSLVLRHAAGRLFQEAHAILESAQLGLFGDHSILTKPTFSPAGAYFTPVPIARLMAEWALQQWPELPKMLTIADYACGSGVFLTEALRALERWNFSGKVRLVGRDKSEQAITMANVAIHNARRDVPKIEVEPDISQADAFDSTWPKAHIVLMNPPFRSWERMSGPEREWVLAVTDNIGRGRPDLSVGFVERALAALQPSGTLVTLIPAGVLASDSLSKWRERLLEKAFPNLIAVLGEHGLFQHALVNVGILGLRAAASSNNFKSWPSINVAWSSASSGAASRAIRALRRSMIEPTPEIGSLNYGPGWSVTVTTIDAWRRRPSWLPGAGALGALLTTLQAETETTTKDLFHVRQGIRTGANEVFLQPASVVGALPNPEKRFFKEAVDTSSFVSGEIIPRNYLFVPRAEWCNESDVAAAVPHFYKQFLFPHKDSLSKRKSQIGERWWELTRARTWAFEGTPRLVSKRFGLYPAFARDPNGALAIVQANAWAPSDRLVTRFKHNHDGMRELLTSYWWLLNSRVAVALFREFCPNVAGGQLDLEHKYVKHVPMPDLVKRFQEDPGLQALATSIRIRCGDRLPAVSDRDKFAALAFQTDVSEWNFLGLELPE